MQALDRMTFGPRPGDVDSITRIGVKRWTDAQLHPERINDAATDRLLARFPAESMHTADLARVYVLPQELRAQRTRYPSPPDSAQRHADSVALKQADAASSKILTDLQAARVARAVTSRRQLLEVMTDFWENHFSIYSGKGPERYMLVDFDRTVIRPNALGKFRDLLGAVAHSPAMLYYLDNWQSGRRGHGLNENYGRELLELHTLGVDGGYTQQDVIDVARAFTGWTIEDPEHVGRFEFRPEWHDAGPKSVLGHSLPANQGLADGETVLDIVSRHPATAKYIATKLARRFVSDTPPAGLVARATATFMRTDGDIREVLGTILTSHEFYAAYHTKVKSPFEFVVSAQRALNAPGDTTGRSAQAVATLGEPIFGHVAPNGYPETGDEWMNAGALLNRVKFVLGLKAPALETPEFQRR